jgi:hypothetical protein
LCGFTCNSGYVASAGTCQLWTPLDMIPPPVTWLNGSDIITSGSNIEAMIDRTGGGNGAYQATGGYQPTLGSPINSKPVVHFNGSEFLTIADVVALQWGTADFLIAELVRNNSASNSSAVLWNKQVQTAPFTGPALWGALTNKLAFETDYVGGDLLYGTGQQDNGVHLDIASRVSGLVTLREDSTNYVLTMAQNISAAGQPVNIGANASGGQGFTGDIAEIVVVKGTTSASDYTALIKYFDISYAQSF